MAIIGSHKRMIVYKKTEFKCACCGSTSNLTCDHFLPKWIRIVDNDIRNLIPMCYDCNHDKADSLIYLHSLKYLPDCYVRDLLQYYAINRKFIRYYVEHFSYRAENFDVDDAIRVLNSYDATLLSRGVQL